MERCPYCGATVRSGARFCTSCGRRLAPSGGDESVATGESEATEEAPVAASTVWESAPTVVERPATSPEDWLRRTPVASADLWPASARAVEASRAAGDGERGGEGSPRGDEADPDAADQAAEPDAGDEVVWPSSPWSSWTLPETEVAAADEPADRSEAVEAMADEQVLEELPADLQAAFGSEEVADQPATVEPEEEPVAAAAVPAESASERQSGDAFGRALALVDELRALLPAVAGAAGIDLAGAVAELAAARREAALPDAGDLDRLEVAVAAARERPREIDALSGLSGNVDGLAAVIAAHRRYAAAIDRALALLGGSSATGTEAFGSGDLAER